MQHKHVHGNADSSSLTDDMEIQIGWHKDCVPSNGAAKCTVERGRVVHCRIDNAWNCEPHHTTIT